MSVNTPDTAAQVEARMKADVAREAPDSNPYLTVHWLRSLIAGVARRVFDFYRDLRRTERRLFPDTADSETAPRWGNIYVGPPNAASPARGFVVAGGTIGGTVNIGDTWLAGGVEYDALTSGVVSDKVLAVSSITRSGSIATVTTATDHNLSSFIPVTIAGADQAEYNVAGAAITVIAADQFQYDVTGTPASPATGTITATATTVLFEVQATSFGDVTNLDADAELLTQTPIVDVNDQAYVTFGAVGGGSNDESTPAYKLRYLDKLRKPVANFNDAAIIAQAKTVAGVTRVFVERAGTEIGTVAVTSITRSGNVATVTTATPHGFEDGSRTTVNGADQPEYNVENVPIIVESTTVFHYVVTGTPVSPATGTITCATTIALGQVRTFFMRDNDVDPIPSASEVTAVKTALDAILPATTSTGNNIVSAPIAVPTNFTFTEITPNTPTMQAAVEANLGQFYAEDTVVGRDITEDEYRAAIQNTVDPDTGDTVETFALSGPSGPIAISSGEIGTLGVVAWP